MRAKTWLVGFFMILSLAGMAGAAPGAEEAAEPPCTPVARLFGQTVCREEIVAEETHLQAIKQQYEMQGLDSEQAIRHRNLERLKDTLWQIALKEKFGEERIEPTTEEIYHFGKAFKNSLRRGHEENLQNAAKIRNYLARRTYTPEEEGRLKALLATIETSIAFYEERQKQHENMPPEFSDMLAEAERGIAESMIRGWKTDKALYEEFGGGLILQQRSVVPVGAYSKFIDYIRTQGGLEILDPAYQGVFTATTEDKGQTLSPENEALYRDFFTSPYWQLENNAALMRETLN